MITISAVPYQYVDDVWPHVERFMGLAVRLQQKLFDVESIKDQLDAQALALWIMIDEETGLPVAAATTRITEYPKRRSLIIDWMGGSRMKEWLDDFSNLMDRYAKDHGCQQIEGMGRKGWLRELKKYGYRPGVPVYVKEL